MGFLWGLLMWFSCHFALNLCLSFSTKYKKNNEGIDLFVAIGAGVACAGVTIFAFTYLDKEIALIIGGAIGFLTGGLHFYANVKSGELQKAILQQRKATNEDIEKTVEAFRSILANDDFSKQNKIRNTLYDKDFDEQNIVNVEVQLEKLPQIFFGDIDGKITQAIENENSKYIQEVYKLIHQEAVEENDEDCENALLNVDFVNDEEEGWQLAFLECLAEKQNDCFYIILALSSDSKTKRYLVAMRTSNKTNQFGYGVGEFGEVNPDTSNIQHGETSTNYFDVVDSMKLALSKPNPKAKKVSAITSAVTKKAINKKPITKNVDDIDDNEDFIVSEQEVEKLVDLFNNNIVCVNDIIQEMGWTGKKAKGFLDFLSLMGYVGLENEDLFDENLNSLIIREDSIQELIDELPVEIDESAFDEEWHKELSETIQGLVVEMAPKNISKYSFDDIDLIIGKSFCCVRHKPDGLCQEVQDTIRECAKLKYKTKKEFSLEEIKKLIQAAFAKINSQDDESDDGNDDNDEAVFEIGKVYQLADLESKLNTSTGYAQHIFMRELMLEGLKAGGEDVMLDKRAMGELNGKQKPILEVLYMGMQNKAQSQFGEKETEKTPIEAIQFSDNPKSATLTFINPKIYESRTMAFIKVKAGEMMMTSLFRLTETLDAMLLIKSDKTFTVSTFKDWTNQNAGFERTLGSITEKDTKENANKIQGYGLNPDDPICLTSVNDTYTYLNFLKCSSSDEEIVNKVRLGSMSYANVMLDKWQITVKNKKLNLTQNVVLYMNGYARHNDFNKAPKGFTMK